MSDYNPFAPATQPAAPNSQLGNPFDPFSQPAPSSIQGNQDPNAAMNGVSFSPQQPLQGQHPNQAALQQHVQPNMQVTSDWQQQQQQQTQQVQQHANFQAPLPGQQPPQAPPAQDQSYMNTSYQTSPGSVSAGMSNTQAPGFNNALVPSQQPSNPYAGYAGPNAQSVVVSQQQSSQWAVSPSPNNMAASGFDPFAAAPAPPPPVPVTPPVQVPVQPTSAAQGMETQALVPAPSSGVYPGAPPPQEHQSSVAHSAYSNGGRAPEAQPQKPTTNETAIVPHNPKPVAETPSPRNKYSGTIAQTAPLGASPLPRAEMVRQTGFVLSRISFRTIVMKKWKQTFWVQYGPHTMLWFRSQSDFDDWLNNPYHTQGQRNFLIKLAVNFAHDLYKPNVRGYQVTQCRTKNYGIKLLRQFKLERWMDYGPTIAAAFASHNPKEVDDLREALVNCMRNTPLNGGIRATGAVRDRPDSHEVRHAASETPRRASSQSEIPPHRAASNHGDNSSYAGHPGSSPPKASASVASEVDLMNDHNMFSDTASLGAYPTPGSELMSFQQPPQQGGAVAAPGQQYPAGMAPYGAAAQAPYAGAPSPAQYYAPAPAQQFAPQAPVQQYGQPPAQQYGQPQQFHAAQGAPHGQFHSPYQTQ